jgi:hypothetical protein
MGFFSRLAGTAITLSLAAGAYQYLRQHHVGLAAFGREPLSTRLFDSAAAHDDEGAEHFSPSENLERLELDHLKVAAEHARAVKRPLDIAIYAFTDRLVAALLVREAEEGTVIRIYRDGEQYENEERNATSPEFSSHMPGQAPSQFSPEF